MNRPEERKKKRKRVSLLLAALVLTALFAGSVVFSINAMGEAPPETSVNSVNEERSQLLVSGKNYSLEKEQEELYSTELEREQEIREEEKEEEQKEENQPEEIVESIVKEEKTETTEVTVETTQTPTPEPSDTVTPTPTLQPDTPTPTPEPSIPQTPTPEPTKSPTPEPSDTVTPTPTVKPSDTATPTPKPSDSETPTPKPSDSETPTPKPSDSETPTPKPSTTPEETPDPGDGDDPGDDGTPVPSDGPDDGHDGDGDGEGEEGDNPTPTPTETPSEPPVADPRIECSLDYENYTYGGYFSLKCFDHLNRLIGSTNYSVWFDDNILYSSGSEGDAMLYRPTDYIPVTAGDHEITVSVFDDEGNTSSKTYSVYIENQEEEAVEEYVTIEVDIGQIYTSGSNIILSDYVQIYNGESAASLVDRVLRNWGFELQTGDGADYYLARISKPGMIDLEQVKEEYREVIFTTDSLGERDVTHTSGWMYEVNWVRVLGMSSVVLHDNDYIRLWFDLAGALY